MEETDRFGAPGASELRVVKVLFLPPKRHIMVPGAYSVLLRPAILETVETCLPETK